MTTETYNRIYKLKVGESVLIGAGEVEVVAFKTTEGIGHQVQIKATAPRRTAVQVGKKVRSTPPSSPLPCH